MVVFDTSTNLPMGQVVNMSQRGMQLMTEQPVETNKLYYCRMPLPETILGSDEIFFDADCRWCCMNESTGWYDSGYRLRRKSPRDAEIIEFITRRWMMMQSENLNSTKPPPEKKKRGLFTRLFQSLLN
jgi:hypothetical protein